MKRIVEDYEAKLRPPTEGLGGKGKIEWKRYGDGTERLYARFRELELPDGARVEIKLDQAVLGTSSISGAAGHLKFENAKGDQVPKAVTGQVAEVVHNNVVLLKGMFIAD